MEARIKTRKTGKIVGMIVGMVLLLGVIAFLTVSAYIGKQVGEGLLYQNRENDTKDNSVKQLEIWNYDKEDFLTKHEEHKVTFQAEDGNIVPAVVFEENHSGQVAILIHGAGGDHVCMYPVAEPYLENGYDVLIIDQRASGDSQNQLVSFGYFESLDVKAAVDYARKELKAQKVVAHGQSMGGLTLIVYAATAHANENLDAVILDSAINSMGYVLRGMWNDMEGTEGIPVDYAIACGDWYLKTFYHFGFEDLESKELLQENHIPTLMIYATQDDLVPPEIAEEMFQSIASPQKQFSPFQSGHIKSIIDYKQECAKVIMDFLKDC